MVKGFVTPEALYYYTYWEESFMEDALKGLEKKLLNLGKITESEREAYQELWEVYVYIHCKKYKTVGLRYRNFSLELLLNFGFVREMVKQMGDYNNTLLLTHMINMTVDDKTLEFTDLHYTNYKPIYDAYRRVTGRCMYLKLPTIMAVTGIKEIESKESGYVLYEMEDAMELARNCKEMPYYHIEYSQENGELMGKHAWLAEGLTTYLGMV